MRKLLGVPFVSLFLILFAAQVILPGPGLAISFCVLAGLGLQKQKAVHVFLIAYLAMFIAWFIFAFYLDNLNRGILAERILGLFPLGNRFTLMLFSSFIGGIWAGSAALAGLAIGRIFNTK